MKPWRRQVYWVALIDILLVVARCACHLYIAVFLRYVHFYIILFRRYVHLYITLFLRSIHLNITLFLMSVHLYITLSLRSGICVWGGGAEEAGARGTPVVEAHARVSIVLE